MATYPGMNLRGEVRESVSLDEDDLSDVEDEVFIRDGKNGYKFEDISVKKPLMAPRRKIGRSSDVGSRIINRPPCRAMCKLCCYASVALTVLIGLIVLVVILVSLFPLPLDKLKEWIISKTNEKEPLKKVVPCSNLKVTDIWTVNFPKFISESSVQILDVNQDGIDDVIFGFGTGDDNTLPPELFCGIFLGLAPPCLGGVVALNGSNGNILWRHGLSNSVFSLICTVDINVDNVTDCLITGKGGIFSIINARNGTPIWEFSNKVKDPEIIMDIYWANFIPDQDNDTIPDILASHTSQKIKGNSRPGHILVVSGKTGTEIQTVSTPNNVEIYYTPQLLLQSDGNYSVLFGTGSPTVPGNLSIVPLKQILAGNMTPHTLYEDRHKGVLSPSVLVDITGDNQPDIIAAMFNTTIIAIDGKSLKQIWNYSIPDSETLSIPTPGYFNNDNVTDFLVKYQTGRDFPTYYYSQTFILNGKTGTPIYSKPIIDSVGSQMGGLTLGMEGYGFDMFLYWMADCKNFEGNQDIFEFIPGTKIQQQSRADICKLRFNSSMVTKLYALNQFEQPPGIQIYNSANRIPLEYNNTKTPIEEVRAYLNRHPEVQFHASDTSPSLTVDDVVVNPDYDQNQEPFRNVKYEGGSSFRHKDNGQGLIRDFTREDVKRRKNPQPVQPKYVNDYEQPSETWQQQIASYPGDDLDTDYTLDDQDSGTMYSPNKLLLNTNIPNSNNRDPRSKSETTTTNQSSQESIQNSSEAVPKTSKKKNLAESPRYGIYDYKNVQKAHTRLLHDLNNLPSEILRDTYFKNRENQLRKSRFEQRDLKSHEDRIRENEEVQKVIEHEKKTSYNLSESLWDLESEKELQDKENGYWRGKREVSNNLVGIPRLTSVGALASSFNETKNSIDLIFMTYWLPPKKGAQILIQKDFQCINDKLKKALDSKEQVHIVSKTTLEELFMKECLQERGVHLNENTHSNANFNNEDLKTFPYYNQVAQLNLGQMTVYRLQLECTCTMLKKDERCVKFLKLENQHWASYLGKFGDGIFKRKN